MNIGKALVEAPEMGPYGGLADGDVRAPARHAPVFNELDAEKRRRVNEVWQGRRRKLLLWIPSRQLLLYVTHRPAGHARAGRRYGYVLRELALPGPPDSAARPEWRRFRAFILALLLLAAGVGFGRFWP